MNNMNNNSLPELKIIAEALKSLKEKKIIRTKNLVGDLGEYYCKEYFGLNSKGLIIINARLPSSIDCIHISGFPSSI